VINFGKEKLGYAKSALFLPGKECKDIKLAFSEKLIDLDSNIIAIEENKNNHKEIRHYLSRYDLWTLYDRKAENTKIISVLPINFSFLDFCGEISPKKVQWLKSYRNHLDEDAVTVFTFSLKWRNNHYRHSDHHYEASETFWGKGYNCNVNVPSGPNFNQAIITLHLINKLGFGKIERAYCYNDTSPMFVIFCSGFKNKSEIAKKAWQTRRKLYGLTGIK